MIKVKLTEEEYETLSRIWNRINNAYQILDPTCMIDSIDYSSIINEALEYLIDSLIKLNLYETFLKEKYNVNIIYFYKPYILIGE